MPAVILKSDTDALDLDSIAKTGFGVQAHDGTSGMGLPAIMGQWDEGAGDGARWRRDRVLSRVIDLPLSLYTETREELEDYLRRLTLVLADPSCTLQFINDDDETWSLKVRRTGGGDYVWGKDTIGETEFEAVLTLQAGDPFWQSDAISSASVLAADTTWGLLSSGHSLVELRMSPSEAIGSLALENKGTAPAYPIWQFIGPGSNLHAQRSDGLSFLWRGTLSSGEKLIVDTSKGTVVDGTGANRYDLLDPAPKLWSLPPGLTTVIADMSGTTPGVSRIIATWHTRNWLVI